MKRGDDGGWIVIWFITLTVYVPLGLLNWYLVAAKGMAIGYTIAMVVWVSIFYLPFIYIYWPRKVKP